jgi:hypothetical protein
MKPQLSLRAMEHIKEAILVLLLQTRRLLTSHPE